MIDVARRSKLSRPHRSAHAASATALQRPGRRRHFQPRGLAVTKNSKRLYVTRFFSFVRPGGKQGDDNGRQGVVCRLNINTKSAKHRRLQAGRSRSRSRRRSTGFTIDSTGDGVPDPTSAFPNQLQSIVIRGNQAYLPNIAASPDGPLRFNVDTQAFVNVIDGVSGGTPASQSAASSSTCTSARATRSPARRSCSSPTPGRSPSPSRRGNGAAYVVSAGSDLLVKVNVDGSGKLDFTVDADTTRYIDLNDPANPATSGDNAGKNPQGIVINKQGTRAYVTNFVSRNVSRRRPHAPTGGEGHPHRSAARRPARPRRSWRSAPRCSSPRAATSTARRARPSPPTERLSSEGWQSCASCHFEGLTDSVVWEFGTGRASRCR